MSASAGIWNFVRTASSSRLLRFLHAFFFGGPVSGFGQVRLNEGVSRGMVPGWKVLHLFCLRLGCRISESTFLFFGRRVSCSPFEWLKSLTLEGGQYGRECFDTNSLAVASDLQTFH